MTAYREQLAAAVHAVEITGPASYRWLGRRGPSLPPALEARLRPAERRHHLVTTLRDELYRSFYCHGRPAHVASGSSARIGRDPELAEALARANAGTGGWEPGWTVQALDGDEAVVTTPQLRARVAIADCRGPVHIGGEVQLRLPKDLHALSPGFCTMISDAPEPPGPGVRVYWHVTPAGAPALVRALTSALNAAAVPFRFKVADHPRRFDRCDAAVLYLPLAAFAAVGETLPHVAAGLDGHLRARTPAFTFRLADGLGAAEDDGGGESFGLRCCALLSDGLVRAHERRVRHVAERIDAVAARFAEDGVVVDAPYRAPSLAGRHVL